MSKQPIKKVGNVSKIPLKKNNKSINKQPVKSDLLFYKYGIFKMSKKDMKRQDELTIKTSKLEYLFMHNFLDKLGIKYQHQWVCPAKFVYDFAIFENNSPIPTALIEIDGDFYHSHPDVIKKQGFMYESQKKQVQRDNAKTEWAELNGYVLIRYWENDIKKHKIKVLNSLKKRLVPPKDKDKK